MSPWQTTLSSPLPASATFLFLADSKGWWLCRARTWEVFYFGFVGAPQHTVAYPFPQSLETFLSLAETQEADKAAGMCYRRRVQPRLQALRIKSCNLRLHGALASSEYMCVYVCMCDCVHACVRVCTCAWVCVHVCICMYMRVCVCMCVCNFKGIYFPLMRAFFFKLQLN